MGYQIIQADASRSFPEPHAFFDNASKDGAGLLFIGQEAGAAFEESMDQTADASFLAIEVGTECLGVHIDQDYGPENVVGFARFRLGDDAPTKLVELVRMPFTTEKALAAARAA